MELIPVIQCIILMVYVIIYINIWPIHKLATSDQYKTMLFLDVVVVVIYLVTDAPIEVFYILGAVTIKDLFMWWYSWLNR